MKKILSFAAVAVLLSLGAGAAFQRINTYSGQFFDVKDTAWYAEDVKTAYDIGLMNGKSQNEFDPDGNVSVVEAITIASRIHSAFYDKQIENSGQEKGVYRIEFDDKTNVVDLSDRNSRNDNGISFGHADGRIEKGVLVVQPNKTNSYGNYDPQVIINGLELGASDYSKITFRMKRDKLDNLNPDAPRNENVEIYFKTTSAPSVTQDKCVYAPLPKDSDLAEWLEVSVEMGEHEAWKDVITGIRFDPTNNNGIYYIDYIEFSKGQSVVNQKWYDVYVDYAIDNGIVDSLLYSSADYNRNITRKELCNLFLSAVPPEELTPINDIKGIADVSMDEKNSDAYLMLYNAGIILGDQNGNFNGDFDIKRSEICAIINRFAFEENRVKGQTSVNWREDTCGYDLEFDDNAHPEIWTFEAESVKVENGALVLKARNRGVDASPQFDPRVVYQNVSIDADKYTKLRVRISPEFLGEVANTSLDFFFTNENGESFSAEKGVYFDYLKDAVVDIMGWYIFEIDLAANDKWKGNITSFRFDPGNTDGIYTIDYIRFVQKDVLFNASHEMLISQGYKATKLLQDPGFENGFHVMHYEQQPVNVQDRRFVYGEDDVKPLWNIGPWWCGYDLWENRAESDKYTLADDKGINTVIYNPDEKSLSMRLDATKIYNGKPHINEEYKWWPHLLLDQAYGTYPVDKEKNRADADRMYVELDMRITDFKDTTNTDGVNNCSFLAYFYFITDKDPNNFIWFGFHWFSGTDKRSTSSVMWTPDSAAHQYMYGLPQTVIYDGMQNSFNPEKNEVVVTDEWKHIRVDITEHIDKCIQWANRDGAFDVEVTKEDMYFGGANIGFEIHGNYDMTVEIKNFDIIAYNK